MCATLGDGIFVVAVKLRNRRGLVVKFSGWRRLAGRSGELPEQRLRYLRTKPVIENVEHLRCFDNFVGAADMIRMGMRGNKIIKLLHVVALERVEHHFAFASIARVYQYRLAAR